MGRKRKESCSDRLRRLTSTGNLSFHNLRLAAYCGHKGAVEVVGDNDYCGWCGTGYSLASKVIYSDSENLWFCSSICEKVYSEYGDPHDLFDDFGNIPLAVFINGLSRWQPIVTAIAGIAAADVYRAHATDDDLAEADLYIEVARAWLNCKTEETKKALSALPGVPLGPGRRSNWWAATVGLVTRVATGTLSYAGVGFAQQAEMGVLACARGAGMTSLVQDGIRTALIAWSGVDKF